MTGEPAGDGLLTFELRDGIALVGLNRPEKRNAISDRVVEALDAAITRAEAGAQAAVLFGHGPHFSAGLDLAEHAERGMLEGIRNSRRWHEVFGRIEFGTIPWVCALHGAVVGGGLELAAAAHVRVADPSTYLALPEGTRGIFVGGGASVRVSRLMGVARMTDLMLTGRSATAEEAERWGVVQYLSEAGGAVARAEALARKAAGNSAFSNYAIIHALPRIATMSGEDGLFVESFVASFASMTPEAGERLRAFLDKRAGKVGAPGT